MKKILLIVLFVALIIPQIAFAAWYNPFTWNWSALFNSPKETVQPIDQESRVTPPPTIATEETSTQVTQIINNASTTKLIIPKEKTPTKTQVTVTQNQLQVMPLRIENVTTEITYDLVTINWTTTVPTHSQLVLSNQDKKGYESLNGIGKTHKVTISNPVPSAEYNYTIFAYSDDGHSTNYLGSFTAKRVFVVAISQINNCPQVTVLDTENKPNIGANLKVSGSYLFSFGSSVMSVAPFSVRTDVTGTAKLDTFCGKPIHYLRITGTGIDYKH